MNTTQQKIKSLNEAIKRYDHNQIYEFSNRLLKDHPDDQEYQYCLILSSLKMSMAQQLKHTYFKHPPTNQYLQPIYAYYLYDKGQFQATISYINSIKQTSSLKLLLAQAHYRSMNYQKSSQIMISLLKDKNISQEQRQEYVINLMASGLNKTTSLDIFKQYQKILLKAQRHEILFNYALIMLESENNKRCMQFLNQFQNKLNKQKDYSDIVSVNLLRDYLEWKNHKNIQKSSIIDYQNMLQKTSNKNLRGVIQNNILFLKQNNGIQHASQTLKMLDQFLQPQYKMTKKQKYFIQLNKLTILIRKNKQIQALKLLKQIQSKQEISKDPQYIKSKYYFMKKNKDPQLTKYINQISQFNTTLGYCLRADQQKQNGTETNLISDLKKNKQNHPLIKNFIFSLLIKHSSLFQQYSDYLWEMAAYATDVNVLNILLNLYQNKQDTQKQKFILQKILKLQPKNQNAKVKLAKIYTNNRMIDQAQQILKGIDEPDDLGDNAYLQFIQRNIHVSITKEQQIKNDKNKKADNSKKRIKKKKRVRLPKNIQKYIQNFKGDPERWLPKWQRKGYKKKGKKGTGKTQGLATTSKQQTKNVYSSNNSTSNKQVTKQVQKKKK